MKKQLFIVLMMVVPLITLAGITNVPKKVKTSFLKQYGDTYAEWNQLSDGKMEATFVVDLVITKAVYSVSGKWISTTANLREGDLHPCVIDYLDETYEYYNFWDGQSFSDPSTKGIE